MRKKIAGVLLSLKRISEEPDVEPCRGRYWSKAEVHPDQKAQLHLGQRRSLVPAEVPVAKITLRHADDRVLHLARLKRSRNCLIYEQELGRRTEFQR